jgi:hypothetical protein
MTEVPARPGAERARAVGTRPVDGITGSSLDPGVPLIWRRSLPLVPDFELYQGRAFFGEMEPASGAGVDATGECLGRSLELRMEITLLGGYKADSRVSMTDQAGPAFKGLFPGWGRVVTPQGEVLRWRHGLWRLYDHKLLDADGRELLRLRPTFLRFGRTETRVLIGPPGWARPDLADLILLTWFLRVHSEARGRRVFLHRTWRRSSRG